MLKPLAAVVALGLAAAPAHGQIVADGSGQDLGADVLAKLAAAASSQLGDEQSLQFTKLAHPSKMATRHPKRFACGFVSDGSQPARPFAYSIEFNQFTVGEPAGSGSANSDDVNAAMQESGCGALLGL